MKLDDDQLLDVLGAVLRPPEAPADPVGLAALQRAVQEKASPRPTPGFWPSFRRSLGRPFVVVLVGTAVVSGGTAVALTNGAPLPRPLRSAAHALGLPVDSVAVAEVRTTMASLEDAIADGDERAVRRRSAELRAELAGLSAEDRAEVGPDARALLRRADVFLGQDEPDVGDDDAVDQGRGDAGRATSTDDRSDDQGDDAVATGFGATDDHGDDSVSSGSGSSGTSGSGSGSGVSGSGSSGTSGSGSSGDGDDDGDGGSSSGGSSGSPGGSDDDDGGGGGSSGGEDESAVLLGP